MPNVDEISQYMEAMAPSRLAEEWDNVGLLLGDRARDVQRVMTCLTVVPENVQEAIQEKADLVISHHPLIFRPLKKITTETTNGSLIWNLAQSGISLYSPHTSWDNASEGINQQLADMLELSNIMPLVPNRALGQAVANQAVANQAAGNQGVLGTGRFGTLATPTDLPSLAQKLEKELKSTRIRWAQATRTPQRIAIVCGSGASMLSAVHQANCDTLLTGEGTFHQCLEAEALGINLLMIGHFASEKFAMQRLAERLSQAFPTLHFWSSRQEVDPVQNYAPKR